MSRKFALRLRNDSPLAFALFASLAGFATYFSMYAFRKPFAAASYGSVEGWHYALDFKIAIVIAQALGYATSKFIGIRSDRRDEAHLPRTGHSWVDWQLVDCAAWHSPRRRRCSRCPPCMLNGLCLGLIWGLVFSYMEGRRISEVLGAVLCASFIVSSGAVKSAGLLLIQIVHVPVFWMPAATGLLFVPLLALGVWGLIFTPSTQCR